MPGDFDPLRAIQLAGTVSIPSPSPEAGTITFSCMLNDDKECPTAGIMLRIEHVLSNRLTIKRSVRLEDVRAVHLADDLANIICPNDDECEDLRGQWFYPSRFEVKNDLDFLLAILRGERAGAKKKSVSEEPKKKSNSPARQVVSSEVALPALMGTFFVQEDAPVLMEVSIGMTAAESAQYRPPMAYDCMSPEICHING